MLSGSVNKQTEGKKNKTNKLNEFAEKLILTNYSSSIPLLLKVLQPLQSISTLASRLGEVRFSLPDCYNVGDG